MQQIELEKLISDSKKDNIKQKNTFKNQLETLYEKLTSSEISMQEKFNLSHILIDRIVFDKATDSLYLTYKYQM